MAIPLNNEAVPPTTSMALVQIEPQGPSLTVLSTSTVDNISLISPTPPQTIKVATPTIEQETPTIEDAQPTPTKDNTKCPIQKLTEMVFHNPRVDD